MNDNEQLITVKQLIEILHDYDPDLPVIVDIYDEYHYMQEISIIEVIDSDGKLVRAKHSQSDGKIIKALNIW